tara:strand:+ start:226 stop:498 length:273 start_codon:yes stop_codon:yes gene_type:complete
MSEQLEKEIQHLNRLIMNVGTKVEEALQNAMNAVREMDPAKAKMVNENNTIIDQLEVKVEEASLKCLALYQPVAIDLRYIFAVSKINNDL